MFNLIVAAELWVLIRDGMKTMRTSGHNHLWLRPSQSLVSGNPPGITGPLHMVKRVLQPVGEFRRRQHPFAPNVNNVKHLLISYGTNFDACITCRAGPGRLFIQGKVEQGPWTLLSRGKTREDGVQLEAFIDENRRRTERLPGVRRRTD